MDEVRPVVVRIHGCSLPMEGSELRPMEAKVLALIFTIYSKLTSVCLLKLAPSPSFLESNDEIYSLPLK